MMSRASGSLAVSSRRRDLPFVGQERVGPDELAVDLGGQRGLGQPRADLGGNIDRSNAARILQDASVGQIDFEHTLQYMEGGRGGKSGRGPGAGDKELGNWELGKKPSARRSGTPCLTNQAGNMSGTGCLT